MKIAVGIYQNKTRTGQLSEDGQSIHFFELTDPEHALGALTLVQRAAGHEAPPPIHAQGVPLSQIQLAAPMPKPIRNLFCVGRKIGRAHV